MSVKRIIIPTITMVIIASQLMGCAAADQNELLQMMQNSEAIEIEVASPAFAEEQQGEESTLLWEQLALLETNETLRSSWDDQLGITVTDTGKNGILYVDAEGNNENNNTLRVALHNREFAKLLEDENSMLELSQAVQNNYCDLEVDETEKSVYMGINGYFNLLPDATPNYCNPDATLQRNEFMAMVHRAETPVSDDLVANEAFNIAVGQSDYNIYAQGVAENSYLDIESKSLDNMTYNGSITRAEAIYLLVSRYFADDLASVDISTASFSDAKDGGNIAEEQKFIEDATSKDHWKSYELTYALTNPDQGVPTDLYKALVVAQNKGLIGSETRWDEAITASESIELLVNTLTKETGIPVFNFKQGTVEGYEVTEDTNTESSSNSASTDVVLEEGEYQGDEEDKVFVEDNTTKELQQLEELYNNGEITKEMYEEIKAGLEQWDESMAELREQVQQQTPSHIDVEVPGGIPASEATEQESNLGKGGELPDHLKGKHIY